MADLPPRPTQTASSPSARELLDKLKWIESAVVVLVESTATIAQNQGSSELNAQGRQEVLERLRDNDREMIIDALADLRGALERIAPPVAPRINEKSMAARLPTGHVVEIESLNEHPKGDTTGEITINGERFHIEATVSWDSVSSWWRRWWPRVRPYVGMGSVGALGHFWSKIVAAVHMLFSG